MAMCRMEICGGCFALLERATQTPKAKQPKMRPDTVIMSDLILFVRMHQYSSVHSAWSKHSFKLTVDLHLGDEAVGARDETCLYGFSVSHFTSIDRTLSIAPDFS